MKKISIYLVMGLFLAVTSCYKDLGDYVYQSPDEPQVSNLDSVYNVFVGDSLIIHPTITTRNPKANIGLSWTITVADEARSVTYQGKELKIVYGLNATRYSTRLTLTDSTNGMKYFHDFFIQGQTDFSVGTTVLSLANGITELSFIKPDGTVRTGLYRAAYGEDLPAEPQQVISIRHQYISPFEITSYWVLCADGNTSVQLDANTFKRIKYLKANFFTSPVTIQPGYLEGTDVGVMRGVINGKLYVGTSQTWNLNPLYGMFGLSAEGDYVAFRKCLRNAIYPFFLGYDVNRKQFIAFTDYGTAAYIGTNYAVSNTLAFDPKNVGLDLWDFEQVNGTKSYAFGKGSDGVIYELSFGTDFTGTPLLSPLTMRPFVQQRLISTASLWQSTAAEIFYFTSGSKIYRYNPLNQDIKELITDFGGKKVSMIKLIDNDNKLIAGVEGSLYYLDVSTGKFGDILKKIDGISGAPVDVAIRD